MVGWFDRARKEETSTCACEWIAWRFLQRLSRFGHGAVDGVGVLPQGVGQPGQELARVLLRVAAELGGQLRHAALHLDKVGPHTAIVITRVDGKRSVKGKNKMVNGECERDCGGKGKSVGEVRE